MTRKKILAANWKMNKTSEEVASFFKTLSDTDFKINDSCEMWIAAPYLVLNECRTLSETMDIRICAQNCHEEPKGAYTGEVSLPMLASIGITNVLLGHSERRQFFGETHEALENKIASCNKQDFHYIYCVGENLKTRESNNTFSHIKEQLAILAESNINVDLLHIAYEPVWAIGTGRAATTSQAQEVHAFIRSELSRKVGPQVAQSIRILYGGSVKEQNIAELICQKDIDGALVGGASLSANSFLNLYDFCK